MKSAVLYGPSDVRLEEVEKPRPARGEVIIKVDTALTCGTDVKVFLRGGHPRMITPPAAFGHEFSGIVEETGAGVKNFSKGMRVVPPNSAPCGRCFFCRRARENLCEDLLFINGAYSEYVRIPARIVGKSLFEIPDGLSFSDAALVEPLACVLRGLNEARVMPADTVTVSGAGPIGMLFIQMLKLTGAFVISLETDESRRAAAAEAGADHGIDPFSVNAPEEVRRLTGGRGADVGIEVAGIPEAWEETVRAARKGGRVVLFGGCAPGTSITLSTCLLHYCELTVKGVFHHTPYYVEKALGVLSGGLVDTSRVITGEAPLSGLTRALDLMARRKSMKIAVKP